MKAKEFRNFESKFRSHAAAVGATQVPHVAVVRGKIRHQQQQGTTD